MVGLPDVISRLRKHAITCLFIFKDSNEFLLTFRVFRVCLAKKKETLL